MKSRYVSFDAQGVVSVKSEEVSDKDLGSMEVLVRNEASLVSAGTELANLHNLTGDVSYPCRTGYASVGRVVATGGDVSDFRPGDRAFYAGKHAEYERFEHGQHHQWGRLYPVPDAVAVEEAPFVCLAEIAMVAPMLSTVHPGDTVAVFGLGVIGNLCAQIYRIMGCRVIGLDPVAKRCELARQAGIRLTIDCPVEEQVDAVKELTGGEGAQITVDAVGHAAVVRSCVQATALMGQTLVLGTPRTPLQGDINEMLHDVHMRGITLKGAHMWQFPAFDVRGAKKTVSWAYRTIYDWMADGALDVKPLHSHTVRLEQAPEVYQGLRNDRDTYWGVVYTYDK